MTQARSGEAGRDLRSPLRSGIPDGSDTVAGQVMNKAESAVKSGAEVEILRFAA